MPASFIPESATEPDGPDIPGLSPAARYFASTLHGLPDRPRRLAKLARVLLNKRQSEDAECLARAARALAPDDYRLRVMTEWLARKEAPLWHFRLVQDDLRNAAYARALEHFLRPGMTVFEIGTGTGLLALLAARAGAAHVYTCERRADVAAAAREIIRRNGFDDRVTVITKDAHDLELGRDLPERADLFVAEIVDNHLLGESVLTLTQLAKARFLKPGAVLLPRHIAAIGSLAGGQGQWPRYRMDTVMGFDLSAFNRFSPVNLTAAPGEVELLCVPVELLGFDLTRDTPLEGKTQASLVADQAGLAESLVTWLRLDFGNGIKFENRPPQESCWRPMLHVLPRGLYLKAGDSVKLDVEYDDTRFFPLLRPSSIRA